MFSLSNYEAQQEFNRFQTLLNTKEYLTKEEYDFCVAYDSSIKGDLFVNDISTDVNAYAINLNVYSEAEYHEEQFRRERGF